MSYNLLFVCTGNTCRSPMAEALARHVLAERGHEDVDVRSAGTSAWPGAGPSDPVPIVLREIGIDLAGHRATALSPEAVEWADLVLVMSPHHQLAVAELGGEDKAGLVTDYLDGPEAGQSVTDPFGADVETYRRTRDQLRQAVEAVVDHLESSSTL